MAIGMNPRKKGLFGKPFEVPGTPGIGDGMDQVPTGVDPAPGLGMRGEAPEQKMGLGSRLFGKGWEDKAFALGGVMRGDPSGVYMMQQQKAQEQNALAQQAAEMRKRSMDMADWRAKKDYEWANAPAPNNDTVNDFEWYKGLSPEDKALYHQMNPEYRQGPDGRFYRVDTSQGAMPTAPVGKLTPITGGSGGNAGGGF